MSIWCSGRTIGHDEFESDESVGDVRSYVHGGHYPTDDDPASTVDVSHMPAWCVPGHDDDGHHPVGPWLRLGMGAAVVVLDERAVLALVADLVTWLDRPKVYPREGDE